MESEQVVSQELLSGSSELSNGASSELSNGASSELSNGASSELSNGASSDQEELENVLDDDSSDESADESNNESVSNSQSGGKLQNMVAQISKMFGGKNDIKSLLSEIMGPMMQQSNSSSPLPVITREYLLSDVNSRLVPFLGARYNMNDVTEINLEESSKSYGNLQMVYVACEILRESGTYSNDEVNKFRDYLVSPLVWLLMYNGSHYYDDYVPSREIAAAYGSATTRAAMTQLQSSEFQSALNSVTQHEASTTL